jgi:hypothetical protein
MSEETLSGSGSPFAQVCPSADPGNRDSSRPAQMAWHLPEDVRTIRVTQVSSAFVLGFTTGSVRRESGSMSAFNLQELGMQGPKLPWAGNRSPVVPYGTRHVPSLPGSARQHRLTRTRPCPGRGMVPSLRGGPDSERTGSNRCHPPVCDTPSRYPWVVLGNDPQESTSGISPGMETRIQGIFG